MAELQAQLAAAYQSGRDSRAYDFKEWRDALVLARKERDAAQEQAKQADALQTINYHAFKTAQKQVAELVAIGNLMLEAICEEWGLDEADHPWTKAIAKANVLAKVKDND